MYLHNTSFKVVPFVSNTFVPKFVKLLEAFLKIFFDISISSLIAFVVTFLARIYRCHRKSQVMTCQGNKISVPKRPHCAWQGTSRPAMSKCADAS
jgi:hypothetical protein